MSRKFLTAIDLSKNELQNAVVQNLAAAPSSPVKGQLYFDSVANILYWYSGTGWVPAMDTGGGPSTAYYQIASEQGTYVAQRERFDFRDTTGITLTLTDDASGDATQVTANPVHGAVTAETTFGQAAANGAAVTLARSDHTHGTPTHGAADHTTIPLNTFAVPTGSVAMGNQKIIGLLTGTAPTEAATKGYVDNAVAGLAWKDAVRAATTANIALTGTQTIDGVVVVANDRVLVKDQTNQVENGIYSASSGAWTRTTDADGAGDLDAAAVFVMEGTNNGDEGWVCTTNAPITPGTTANVWSQFAGGGAGVPITRQIISGNGLTGGGDLSADRTLAVGAGIGITVAADTVLLDTTYVNTWYARKTGAQSSAGTTTTVNHGWGTRNVTVEVFRNSTPWDTVECDIERPDSNNVTVRFAVAVAAAEYQIVVQG